MGKRLENMSKITMEKINNVDNYILYILLLVIGALPLLVRGKLLQFTSPQLGEAFLSSGIKVDFFSYYKWVFLILLTIIALSLFLYKMVRYRYQVAESYINIPAVVLLFLALLATLFAEYKYLALVGMYNRYDGLITFVCYLMLFFIAANIKLDNKHLKWVLYALGLVTVVNAAMGIVDFYGYKLIENPVLKAIMVPKLFQQSLSGYIMATLNNPNYVSGIGSALTILFTSVAILSSQIKIKIISGLLALPAFCLVLVGLSSGGFIALVLVGALLVLAGLWLKGWRSLIPVIVLALACSGIFIIFNNHNDRVKVETIDGLKSILPQQSSLLSTSIAMAAPPADVPRLTPDHFNLPEAATNAGSGREYIWGKTIELIKQKPLLGYGFDTLTYHFPQYDKYKISGMGSYEIIVDKPHNFFLGMAYGAGIPFLLVFLALVGLHLFNTLKAVIHLKKMEVETGVKADYWELVILFFMLTFLAQGMVNDSIISTTPIFWVLFGLGVSLNREILQK